MLESACDHRITDGVYLRDNGVGNGNLHGADDGSLCGHKPSCGSGDIALFAMIPGSALGACTH
jgi:hypothetical protein